MTSRLARGRGYLTDELELNQQKSNPGAQGAEGTGADGHLLQYPQGTFPLVTLALGVQLPPLGQG